MEKLPGWLLLLSLLLPWHESRGVTNDAIPGTRLLLHLATAPFPHPDRAEGHSYSGKLYDAAVHYRDNTVAVFLPTGFSTNGPTDFVVHFHGWHNHVERVLEHYDLLQQFVAGRRDAILIVPQGPYDAPDSFGGKLEDAGGFQRFMLEIMASLRERHLLGSGEIGDIALAGHSGGYAVISSILTVGGLTGHIHEVWLYDALYGRTPKFKAWFEPDARARFIDVFTDHGGTKTETEKLEAELRQAGTPFLAQEEADLREADLRANRLIFIHTPLEHDEVPVKHRAFTQFLQTSRLRQITTPPTVK